MCSTSASPATGLAPTGETSWLTATENVMVAVTGGGAEIGGENPGPEIGRSIHTSTWRIVTLPVGVKAPNEPVVVSGATATATEAFVPAAIGVARFTTMFATCELPEDTTAVAATPFTMAVM